MESAEKISPKKRGLNVFIFCQCTFKVCYYFNADVQNIKGCINYCENLRNEFSKQSCSNPSVRRPQNYADDTHDDYDGEIEL